jgi:PAS domain S-box-containing protein
MSFIDLVIVGVTIATAYFLHRHRRILTAYRIGKGSFIVLAGLSLIALFFAVDLVTMWLLPAVIGTSRAARAMETLHLDYSWLVLLLAVVGLCVGFLLIHARLLRLIDRLNASTEAFERGERRFRRLFEQAAAGIVTADLSGRITSSNPWLQKFLGYSEQELLGSSILEYIHPDDRDEAAVYSRQLLSGERETLDVVSRRYLTMSGEVVWVHSSVSLVRDETGESQYAIGLLQDVTERERLEHELVEVAAQERERLGRDLHDGLGQQLTGLGLMAEALRRKLEARRATEVSDVKELGLVIESALGQTRFLARGLFPIPIQAGGLGEALQDLAKSAQHEFHVSIEAQVDEGAQIKDPEVGTHLFNIAREAVTNAVRHGRADRIVIGLTRLNGMTSLSIQDDGVGIPGESERKEGVGLRSMRFRAQDLRAELNIRRMDTGGTVVCCTVPRARIGADQPHRMERS